MFSFTGRRAFSLKTHCTPPLRFCELSSSFKDAEKQASGIFQFSRSVMSDSLRPHGLQHARPPCPSPAPRVYSNSCPLSQWCHPTISSSVIPFSSCPQSFPASGSFQMSHFFASGGQSIGFSASASVLDDEHSGLISFMMDWLDLLAVQGTFKSLLHEWERLEISSRKSEIPREHFMQKWAQ